MPVVITGAMHSADAPDADGPANLRDALAVAGSSQARGLGVLVTLAGTVWQPLGLQKVATVDLAGFAGTAVGMVADGRFTPTADKERPFLGELASANAPRVDIARGVPGRRRGGDGCLRRGGRQGNRAGSARRGQCGRRGDRRRSGGTVPQGWRWRCRRGCRERRSARGYGPGRELVDAGAVMVPRLRAPQARVLLIAALASGSPVDDVIARWG